MRRAVSTSPVLCLPRRGMTTPLVAAALLVAMLALALILDRMWLEATRLELITAAEAASLAAARKLASDESLRQPAQLQRAQDEAVQAAMSAALANRAAGQPIVVNESDVQFLQEIPETTPPADSVTTTEEKEATEPRGVTVTAHRTRFRGNPVALFISQLTRQPFGDAVGHAGAELRGPITGVRPLPGTTVPGLPLAIWEQDPVGKRMDTWLAAIEQRKGRDEFRYDEATFSVVPEADGIPELTLTTVARKPGAKVANCQLLDMGTGFDDARLQQQIAHGWTRDDLEAWGGMLRLSASRIAGNQSSLLMTGMPKLESSDRDALEQVLGMPRIALLYRTATPHGRGQAYDIDCVRLVSLRVMQLLDQPDGSCKVVVQPTVIATRTAMLGTAADENEIENEQSMRDEPARLPPQYLYRLQLTQ